MWFNIVYVTRGPLNDRIYITIDRLDQNLNDVTPHAAV